MSRGLGSAATMPIPDGAAALGAFSESLWPLAVGLKRRDRHAGVILPAIRSCLSLTALRRAPATMI